MKLQDYIAKRVEELKQQNRDAGYHSAQPGHIEKGNHGISHSFMLLGKATDLEIEVDSEFNKNNMSIGDKLEAIHVTFKIIRPRCRRWDYHSEMVPILKEVQNG